MPCTGVRRCMMCGLVEPLPIDRHQESDLWHGFNNAVEAHIEWGRYLGKYAHKEFA